MTASDSPLLAPHTPAVSTPSDPLTLIPTTYALDTVRTRYAPYEVLATHHHDRASISVVFRGVYEERVGSVRAAVQPCTVVWKPPAIEHSNHIGRAGLDAMFIEVSPAWLALLQADGYAPRDATFVGSLAARRSALALWQGMDDHGTIDPSIVDELLVTVCVDVRNDGWQARTRISPWLTRVRESVHQHVESGLPVPGLAELAVEAGVHPVYLAERFRDRFGRTIGAYARALRLQRACDMLAASPLTIGSIAVATGFADHSHFVRHFRAAMRVTPSEYRRATRRARFADP